MARVRKGRPTTTAFAREPAELIGKVAKRTLLPGRFVPLAAVRDAYLVQQGAPVQMMFVEGGLTISATAVTLEPGSAGDVVKVRNADSGKVLTGTRDGRRHRAGRRNMMIRAFTLALGIIAALQPAMVFGADIDNGGANGGRGLRTIGDSRQLRTDLAHQGHRRAAERARQPAGRLWPRHRPAGDRRQPAQLALHRTVDPRDARESRHRAGRRPRARQERRGRDRHGQSAAPSPDPARASTSASPRSATLPRSRAARWS